MFYVYDERTTKKGSDKVISLLKMHIKKKVARDMKHLMVHYDGCAGK